MNRRDFIKATSAAGMFACASSSVFAQVREKSNLVILDKFNAAYPGKPVLLPVVIKGKTYNFMIATGFINNMFDKKLEKLLGEPRSKRSVLDDKGNEKILKTYYAPKAFAGKLNLQKGGPVGCADFSKLREITGQKVDGVLGMSFLRKYIIQMNFDTGEVLFMTPDYRKHPEWGQEVNLIKRAVAAGGIPAIAAKLFKKYQLPLILDTGAPLTGLLSRTVFRSLQTDKLIKKTAETTAMTLKGPTVQVNGRVDGLQIGKFEYKNLIMEKGTEGGVGGVAGLGFLSRHIVTFDFPALKLYLKKGKRFDVPDQLDMSGLHLLLNKNPNPKKKGYVKLVQAVDAGSPAAKAGIKAGDYIFKIDGKKTSKMSLAQVRNMLKAGDGKTYVVVFARTTKTGDSYKTKGLKNTLVLKKIL